MSRTTFFPSATSVPNPKIEDSLEKDLLDIFCFDVSFSDPSWMIIYIWDRNSISEKKPKLKLNFLLKPLDTNFKTATTTTSDTLSIVIFGLLVIQNCLGLAYGFSLSVEISYRKLKKKMRKMKFFKREFNKLLVALIKHLKNVCKKFRLTVESMTLPVLFLWNRQLNSKEGFLVI